MNLGIKVYAFHGTQLQFDTFETPAWFSNTFYYAEMFAGHWGNLGEPTEESRVVVAEIVMTNPYYTSDWDVTEALSEDQLKILKDAGHDGVVFTAPEGMDEKEIEFIVFSSDQINQVKSISIPL